MAEKFDVTTDDGAQALEQIDANIERVRSLVEDDNAEAVEELAQETEGIISALTGKGSIKAKKEKRDALKAAATVQERPKAEVQAKPVKTFDQYEGVPELVNMGAEKAVEGVRLNQKASKTARELSEIILEMWLHLPNGDDEPDLMCTSERARKGTAAVYMKVAEALAESGMAPHDAEREVKRIIRSVQNQRSNVRAEFLRSLDENEERRVLFAGVLKGKPEDVSASRWVANHYQTSLIGQAERESIQYYVKNNKIAAVPPHLEALLKIEPGIINELESRAQSALEGTPEEKLTTVVNMLDAEFKKVKKVFKPEEVAEAEDKVRAAQRKRLEEILEEVKELIKATI